MAKALSEVLLSRDYQQKFAHYSQEFQRKYARNIINNREPELVHDRRHSRLLSIDNDESSDEAATADFSLQIGNVERFDLVGCHGISGWSGSFSNSSSKGNLFTQENEQWQVACMVSENRQNWRVRPENFAPQGGQLKPHHTREAVMARTMTLLLGDNFYSNGLGYKKWFSSFNPSTSKTFNYNFTRLPYGRSFSILGNHDWGLWSHGGSDDSEYKLNLALNQVNACYDGSSQTANWHMPNRYYHFTTKKADFYCIDSSSFPYDEAQQRWLKAVYNLQQQKKEGKWQILVSHHPIIGLGKRNPFHPKAQHDAYKYSKYFNPSQRKSSFPENAPFLSHNEILREKLKRLSFDVVLSAHDHTLAGYYLDHNKHPTFQVVSGGGGANIETTTRRHIEPLVLGRHIYADKKNVCRKYGYFLEDGHGYVCMYLHTNYIDFDYYWLGSGHKKITVTR
ncbi:metallophosphoesterase [Fangia hongkongensis]|uniref:metallophosphoesterase n=1 Tax=Fangia hongkongensis TaxID=270495 RepID=UPI00036C4687|nr:metallophosphoesterase [Fangia hongkongensis]MBK2125271.1 hypothetical protein [Fangia hongkongensis]